jgi:signal recognition particle subunit SRP54
MDGDARGGGALSIRQVTGSRSFVGIGKIGRLRTVPSRARSLSHSRHGRRAVSFIEKVEQNIDLASRRDARKLLGDDFTLEDFREQLKQLSKLGSLESILGMLPKTGMFKELQKAKVDEKEFSRVVSIIDSMTPHERANYMIINGSRRRRIAKGSGVTVQQVNDLLKQYGEARKMMKSLTGGLMGGKMPGGRVGQMLGKKLAGKLKMPMPPGW